MAGLTDVAVERLTEPGKHNDSAAGLYLLVNEGKRGITKLWRLRFRINGRESTKALGVYDKQSPKHLGVKAAREAAQDARKQVKLGVSPVRAKASQNAADAAKAMTFKDVAEEFLKHKGEVEDPPLTSKTLAGYRGALTNWAYPVLGDMALEDISLLHVAAVEKAVRTTSMAKFARDLVRAVLGFATASGYLDRNVAVFAKRIRKHSTKRRAAVTEPGDLKMFLERLSKYDGRYAGIRAALELLVLLPVRPVELVTMRWQDLSLDEGDWGFLISKTMRHNKDLILHHVPLSSQAVAILETLKKGRVVNAAGEGWVFPSPVKPGQHRGRDSLLAALVGGLGYARGDISAHGFRSTFRTLAEELLGGDPVVLELMLSHKMPGALGSTYARAALMPRRRELAQKWADYIDTLKP